MSAKDSQLVAIPSLIGKKVYLRPTTASDITNTYTWTMVGEPQSMSCRPFVLSTVEAAMEGFNRAEPSERRQSFTICRKKDKVVVGKASYFDLNNLNRSAELGLLIDPDEHRQGYGSEALGVLVRHLIRYRGLNKVYAQTAEFNVSAVALLKKLDFKLDATLRDHYFYEGSYYPGFIYSLLAYEI